MNHETIIFCLCISLSNSKLAYRSKNGLGIFLNEASKPKCEPLPPVSQNEPSIFYMEARGRLGNNLLTYAVLLQLPISLGVTSVISDETNEYLARYFTPESIKLKSISMVSCGSDTVKWKYFYGDIGDLLSKTKVFERQLVVSVATFGKYTPRIQVL